MNEKEDNIEIESIEQGKLENHSIYTYLMAHPSIFISVVSATTAILTFLIKYVSYTLEAQKLLFWNIDPALVVINNQQLVYTICFSFIYYIMTSIAICIISNTYTAYRPCMMCKKWLKTELSIIKKEIRSVKKELANEKRKIYQLPNCVETKFVRRKVVEIEESNVKSIDKTKYLKKIIRDIKKIFNKMLLRNLLYALIIIIVAAVFLISSVGAWHRTTSLIIVGCLWVAIQFGVCCLISLFRIRSTITESESVEQQKDKIIKLFENRSEIEYPISKIRKYGFKSFFTNFTLYQILQFMFVFIVACIIISQMPQDNIYREQKQFKVVSINETQYVIIDYNSEKMILEEVCVVEGTAMIYTSKQRIVSAVEYPFEVVTFENVVPVNNVY